MLLCFTFHSQQMKLFKTVTSQVLSSNWGLILCRNKRIFCTAGFALSGVQGACHSGLPAEKTEPLLWTHSFCSLSFPQAHKPAAVSFMDLCFSNIDLFIFNQLWQSAKSFRKPYFCHGVFWLVNFYPVQLFSFSYHLLMCFRQFQRTVFIFLFHSFKKN